MKFLTCNAGYLLGYENVLWGYVPPPVTSIVGNDTIEREKLDQLVSVIERERPDVVSLVEIDQGSHRTATDGQYRTLVTELQNRGLPYDGGVANKYANSTLIESLPFWGYLGNAMLTKTDREPITHYLPVGQKRLVLELELTPELVVFAVHLSLGSRSRTRQLRHLADLIERRANGQNVVVTGDFNTFDGVAELQPLTERAGLEVRIPGETVPARPLDEYFIESRRIDLFLCSPHLDVTRCDVLDVQLSDHRPVVLETTHDRPGQTVKL